jgi:hypothetical protein
MKLRSIRLGLATLFAGAMGVTAQAGLIPVNATVTPEGDNYRYTYSVSVASSTFLKSGDSFVIFDFNGFVPGSAQNPSDFTFSTMSTGGTPGRTAPNDDATMPNLIWTYNGMDPISAGALGDFSALSTLPEASVTTDFSARSHTEDPNGNIFADDNITQTKGPAGTNPPIDDPVDPTPGVPEPTTLLLLAAGLPVIAGARYLRGRKQEAVVA